MKEIIYVCGLPGSGKSYYINKMYPNYVIISNDLIVEEYAKKHNIGYNDAWNRISFSYVRKECKRRFDKAISENKNIVIDNTNLTIKSRRKYIANGYKRICIFFRISDSLLKMRTEKRKNETGKYISQSVVEDMIKRTQLPNKEFENFDEIIYVRN